MVADGTLLLFAELARLREVNDGQQLVRAHALPANSLVRQVLAHVGLYRLLGVRASGSVRADSVRYWKVRSGDCVDGEKYGSAMGEYAELFGGSERLTKLYDGLTEAVSNTHQHAYEEPRGDGLANVKKWWMFSQLKDGSLFVAVCDLGIGIPRSIVRDKEPGKVEWCCGV